MASLPYLDLHAIKYRDSSGRLRQWDSASRKPGQPGAVIIVPFVHPSDMILLVRQFRVPLGMFTIEFPAGLIDAGETPEQTVERELYEETGYVCTIRKVFPAACSSAGLTDECANIVLADVDLTLPENQNPVQHPDGSEEIEVLKVPRAELPAFLENRTAMGDCVDCRLMMFAAML